MSLSGLLRAISDDPELGSALEHAALRAAGGGDLIAPPGPAARARRRLASPAEQPARDGAAQPAAGSCWP